VGVAEDYRVMRVRAKAIAATLRQIGRFTTAEVKHPGIAE